LAIGGRDLENGTIEIARRDTKEKQTISREGIADHIENLLTDIQQNIYNKALKFRDEIPGRPTHTMNLKSSWILKQDLSQPIGMVLLKLKSE
jgi:prolyl-tRNA synthetase